MSEFQFKTLQRVVLPVPGCGAANVQGVVIAGVVEMGGKPKYHIHFLDPFKREANGHMAGCIVTIPEPDLLAAQPPEMVTKTEADKAAADAYETGRQHVLKENELERRFRSVQRKANTASRKRTRK